MDYNLPKQMDYKLTKTNGLQTNTNKMDYKLNKTIVLLELPDEEVLLFLLNNHTNTLIILDVDCDRADAIAKIYQDIYVLKKKNNSCVVLFVVFSEAREAGICSSTDLKNIFFNCYRKETNGLLDKIESASNKINNRTPNSVINNERPTNKYVDQNTGNRLKEEYNFMNINKEEKSITNSINDTINKKNKSLESQNSLHDKQNEHNKESTLNIYNAEINSNFNNDTLEKNSNQIDYENNIIIYIKAEYRKFKLKTYKKIIIGGTFDRIHEGHFLLISTALLLGNNVTIGLTTERLHLSKKYKEIIEEYNIRKKKVEYFCNIFSKGKANVVKINDYIYDSDKNNYDCIVVSEETINIACKINLMRENNKLKRMDIVVVPLIWCKWKLSSSDLREGDYFKNNINKYFD